MGFPLGPVSLKIVLGVGVHENLLLGRYHLSRVYLRYVGDTFSVFDSVEDTKAFTIQHNSLHSSLQFTMRMESGRMLPDLNVLDERKEGTFITSV